MSGLDKMKAQIIAEAQDNAKEILAQAHAQADSIIGEAKAQAEKDARKIVAQAEAKAEKNIVPDESPILAEAADDFIPIEDLPTEKIELPSELIGKFEATKAETAQAAPVQAPQPQQVLVIGNI